MVSRLSRRALLSGTAATLLTRRASGDVDPSWRPDQLDLREVVTPGNLSHRFVLGVPRHLAPDDRVPLVVLLHGLGETGDERTGAWAWFERYGLGTSYDRLRATSSFRGVVVACPYMPNLSSASPAAVDAYARWIAGTVVTQAARQAPVPGTKNATYLGGCSLGGQCALEVLLRRPEVFGAWAGVQTAIGEAAAVRYAQRLAATAQAEPTRLLVETSRGDPFRGASERLSRALTAASVANTYVELDGPHDQHWLRGSGTLQMLQWFAGL